MENQKNIKEINDTHIQEVSRVSHKDDDDKIPDFIHPLDLENKDHHFENDGEKKQRFENLTVELGRVNQIKLLQNTAYWILAHEYSFT